MVTIKGFYGLSQEAPLRQKDDSPLARTGVGKSPASRKLSAIQVQQDLEVSNSSDVASILSASAKAASTLTASDRSNIKRFDSVQSATTEMSDLITKIQSLVDEYQNGNVGTRKASAIENEITTLTSTYNQIVQSSGRYTAADLAAFSSQAATVSSASSSTAAQLTGVSASLDPLSSSLVAVNSAIAPTLSALSDFSSSSVSVVAPALASVDGQIATLSTSSSGFNSSMIAVNASLTTLDLTSSTLSTQSDLVNTAIVEVEVSLAATPIPESLSTSSTEIFDAINVLEDGMSLFSSSISSLNTARDVNNASMAVYASSLSSASSSSDYYQQAADSSFTAVTSYQTTINNTPEDVFSSRSWDSLASSWQSSSMELNSSSYDMQANYDYWIWQSDSSAAAVLLEPSLSSLSSALSSIEQVGSSAGDIGSSLYYIYNSDTLISDSLHSAGLEYDQAVISSSQYTVLGSEQLSSAESMGSNIVSYTSSYNSLDAVDQDLLGSTNVMAGSSLTLLNSSSLLNVDLVAVQSSIDNYEDPILVASSNALSTSRSNLTTDLSNLNTEITTKQGSSLLLSSSLSEVSSSAGVLQTSRTALQTTQANLGTSITSLSSAMTPSLSSLSSLSSASSSLVSSLTGLQNGLSSLSAEALALASSYSAAVVQAASSESSSLNSLAGELSDYEVGDGLKIDLSTRTMALVSTEILSNRLSQISAAEAQVKVASQSVENLANLNEQQPTEITVSDNNQQKLNSSQVNKFSTILAGSIVSDPTQAMQAIGQLNVKTVLSLVESIGFASKKA